MKRLLGLALLLLSARCAAADISLLQRFAPVEGKIPFSQRKQLQGLPVALQSRGYIELKQDELLWHTTSPVDSQLKITAAGVSQWQEQQYQAVAGSEFVGQLMLAVLQQQQSFIAEYFSLSETSTDCVQLQPSQAPLNSLFDSIELCGKQQLQQISLFELNGNQTDILLQQGTELD